MFTKFYTLHGMNDTYFQCGSGLKQSLIKRSYDLKTLELGDQLTSPKWEITYSGISYTIKQNESYCRADCIVSVQLSLIVDQDSRFIFDHNAFRYSVGKTSTLPHVTPFLQSFLVPPSCIRNNLLARNKYYRKDP